MTTPTRRRESTPKENRRSGRILTRRSRMLWSQADSETPPLLAGDGCGTGGGAAGALPPCVPAILARPCVVAHALGHTAPLCVQCRVFFRGGGGAGPTRHVGPKGRAASNCRPSWLSAAGRREPPRAAFRQRSRADPASGCRPSLRSARPGPADVWPTSASMWRPNFTHPNRPQHVARTLVEFGPSLGS